VLYARDVADAHDRPQHAPHEPFVGNDVTMAELSPRAIVLGFVLSVVLAGANAYLGLFAGMTVSASIPAAVLSMALLRAFGGTILENNQVQTAASSGESVAAGAIFTLPALLLLGVWTSFDYLDTLLLSGLGGLLGVLFTIPLRRALVVQTNLPFPEGVATAEVLKVGAALGARSTSAAGEGAPSGERAESGVKHVIVGGVIGAVFKLGESGFRLWHAVLEGARSVGGGVVYAGANLSPALVAVGYIVGVNAALVVFAGGVLNWFVAVPWLASLEPHGSASATEIAWTVWSTKTRYLGVGAMIVGGLWALVDLRDKLLAGVRTGLAAFRETTNGVRLPRTERDLPMQWVLGLSLASLVPLGLVFHHVTHVVWVSAVLAVVMLVAGFLFCAVAAYMAGLVGSSNNPVSGVTIATILLTSLLLLGMLGPDSAVGPAAAILVGSVVCCAAAMGGDNVQDLKAGHIVGATPIKQQLMQGVGVLGGALVIAPALSLLLEAYGIGVPTPEHPHPLKAPQATLMAAVTKGVFSGGLPWTLVGIGMALAVGVIIWDRVLLARGAAFRIPVLAAALGLYLPFELSVTILIGGLIASFAERAWRGADGEAKERAQRNGLLLAAGLITGEALAGILLAVPIVVSGRADVLSPWGAHEAAWPGVLFVCGVGFWLSRVATQRWAR
jgi:putative OPT family oligopeptide transporter